MTNHTKMQVLIGLVLVWGGTVVYQYLGEDENLHSSSIASRSSTTVASIDLGSMALADTFKSPRQTTTLSNPKNIFDPLNLYPPPPKPPPSKAVVQKQTIRQPERAQPKKLVPSGPSTLELATRRAEQQLRQFRFLGYLKKGGESQAFLTKGQSIYIVKQGATVEGKILVQRIAPTLIVLSTQILETGDLVKAEIPLTKESQSS